jgi:CelD/BcsL family acetyltransferase involved in cellulose biosynthesis
MAKMSNAKFSRTLLAAAVAVGMAGVTGVALAQDSAAKWTQLQEAVRLAEICKGVTHDAAAWRTLGPKIDAAVNHEIGGGERLTLIETAKTDARVLAQKKGCDSEDAQALLKDYDALAGM